MGMAYYFQVIDDKNVWFHSKFQQAGAICQTNNESMALLHENIT